ncbi:hypothetical protein D3C80_1991520 [compost metagenome]
MIVLQFKYVCLVSRGNPSFQLVRGSLDVISEGTRDQYRELLGRVLIVSPELEVC